MHPEYLAGHEGDYSPVELAMLVFFDGSPYAKTNGLSGEEAMLLHFRHRQELELTICEEVFPDRYTILKSKKYI